jgi:hypothetical protein
VNSLLKQRNEKLKGETKMRRIMDVNDRLIICSGFLDTNFTAERRSNSKVDTRTANGYLPVGKSSTNPGLLVLPWLRSLPATPESDHSRLREGEQGKSGESINLEILQNLPNNGDRHLFDCAFDDIRITTVVS